MSATSRRETPRVDGGPEAPLGALVVPDLDEPAEPLLQDLRARLPRGEGVDQESGRHSRTLGGHLPDPLEQGAGPVFGVEAFQDVGGAGHHGQPLAPAAVRIGRAEPGADGQHRAVVRGRGAEPEDRLGDDEPQVVLHAVFEAAGPAPDGVRLRRAGVHPYLAVRDRYGEGPHVVGEGIEGASAGQIEPGVMPVAGEDAALKRASVQGEPHVRAAVVDGGEPIVQGEDGNGVSASRDDGTTPGLNLFDGPGPDESLCGCGHGSLLPTCGGCVPYILAEAPCKPWRQWLLYDVPTRHPQTALRPDV